MSGDGLGGEMEVNGMMYLTGTEGINTVEVSGYMRVGAERGGVVDICRAIGFVDIPFLGTR